MKHREPRRSVMIAARMRHGAAWSDASILNISSRGLLLHATRAPSRGTYIEVRRGRHVIIARVVWSNENRFGVSAQDRLAVDAIVADGMVKAPPANDTVGFVERRAWPTRQGLEWRHVQSRERARLVEFAFIAGAGLLFAVLAYEPIVRTLSQPMDRITGGLAGLP